MEHNSGGGKNLPDLFPSTEIHPTAAKDEVQKDSRIGPDPFIGRCWKPQIRLQDGMTRVAREMELI